LPTYQSQYTGTTYPPVAQQQALQSQNYRYQPHEVVVHQAAQAPQAKVAPAHASAPQAKVAPAHASAPQAGVAATQARNSAPQAQKGSMPSAAAQQSANASHRGQSQRP